MENVYPVDFFELSRQIKMRNIDEFLMQARIVSNPHVEPETAEEFINDLLDQRAFYRGEDKPSDKLDRAGVEAFKRHVKTESRFGATRQKGEEKDNGVLE